MTTNELVVYGYLFTQRFDHILQYKIRVRDDKFQVIKGKLNNVMNELPDQMLSHVGDGLDDALRFVLQDLRSIEIDNETYPNLPKGDLPVSYLPIVAGIEDAVQADDLVSVIIFGNIEKYKDPIGVQKFLDVFGYGAPKTLPPEVYVLSDFVKEE
jgi:hypothetical protein